MTATGPDWTGIRADLVRTIGRYWPLLLLFAGLGLALQIGVTALGFDAQEREPGLTGYLGYLMHLAAVFLPGALLYVVGAGLMLNGMSEHPVGRAIILRRAMAALPVAMAVSLITLAPFLATSIKTYTNVNFADWWLAYGAGVLGNVGLGAIIGFASLEAIARSQGPASAIRSSVALTLGHRAWLFWLSLAIQAVQEVLRMASGPVDALLVEYGVTLLGASPATQILWSLSVLVTLPLDVVLYFELRRLQAESGSWIGAVFD